MAAYHRRGIGRPRPRRTSPSGYFKITNEQFYPIEDLSVEVSLRCAKIGRGTDTSPMNKCEPSMHTSKQRWTKHTLDGPTSSYEISPGEMLLVDFRAGCCTPNSMFSCHSSRRKKSVALRQTVSLRDETAFGWRHSMGSHPERLGVGPPRPRKRPASQAHDATRTARSTPQNARSAPAAPHADPRQGRRGPSGSRHAHSSAAMRGARGRANSDVILRIAARVND